MNKPLICAGLWAAWAVAASAATTEIANDPHLNVIPRTADEAARIARVTEPATSFDAAQRFEAKPAGAATVRVTRDRNAFSLHSANLSFENELNFNVGNAFFRKLWVSSPASTLASDGLGPLFNARSCQRCHLKDGRGHPPEGPDDNPISMLFKISIPEESDPGKLDSYGAAFSAPDSHPIHAIEGYIKTLPDPVYGLQLQDHSIAGQVTEGRMAISYDEITVPLSGGETARLRAPTYGVSDMGHGPLHPDVMLSPRVAPQMIGLGLLEAIPAADILAWADAEDVDGDGISGRPNIVWSVEYEQPMLGRFGLKASTPTLRHQSAGAFAGDIGISTPLFTAPWGDCTDAQEACRVAMHGDGDVRVFEVDEVGLDLVTFYSRNLGVPARRDVDDPEVLRGKEVFYTTGCVACHRPSYVTHRLEDRPEQSFQLIWPYTDLLLHDMGPGLADNRPEARATGQEWRTPPLWGIGLTEQVSGHTYFLHDGRARSLLEAVLWHGGEAQSQRDAVVTMPPVDRAALIRFLESL